MQIEARNHPAVRASEERLAWLADICRELAARFPGKVEADRIPGERPPSCALRFSDKRLFATFGVIDATYFWTFDGGESCHYAKDKDVMRRLLDFELRRALEKERMQ